MKDHVICKQCGKSFKQLTHKHLKHHNLTTKQYCEKYQLSPGQLLSDSTRQLSKVTLSNMIKSYGQQQGTRRFDQYRKKQAYTNSLEYKQFKHKWTKEQFQQYNKSRAVTLQLCIKRHGIQKGTQIFENYCNRQAYAGVKLQYFIQKYGKQKGIQIYQEIGRSKARTLQQFIKNYGSEVGQVRYKQYLDKLSHRSYKSQISQQLFRALDNRISSEVFKFQSKDGQKYIRCGQNSYFIDFYCPKTKLGIEFYGSYWHADPIRYKYQDQIRFPGGIELAKQIWQKDHSRLKQILSSEQINDILVVWESEYLQNKQKIIQKCTEFLTREIEEEK